MKSAKATSNFGSNTSLTVAAGTRSFLTFALRGVPFGFTHAALRLYRRGSSVKKTQVFMAASNWGGRDAHRR